MRNHNHHIGRRSVLKGAGIGLAGIAGLGIGAGTAGAAPPGAQADVGFNSDEAMRSPRGTAIPMNAVLPNGGYIVIQRAADGQIIGVNPVPLGSGVFPNMLIGVKDQGAGEKVDLVASVWEEADRNRSFSEGDVPYGATASATVQF